MTLLRFAPVLVMAVLLLVFLGFGGARYLSFDELARLQHILTAWVAAHPALAPVAYVSAYIAVVACSLPVGSWITVLGGLLFGPLFGTVLALIGATTGASLVYLAARTALGDVLRRRAGPLVKRMDAGFRDNAFHYLLALRLIPVFPFALVNLVPAFFPIPLLTFVAATLIGILPATTLCAVAGYGLGAVLAEGSRPELSILSRPEIFLPLIGLGLLALLPVLVKKLRARGAAGCDPS